MVNFQWCIPSPFNAPWKKSLDPPYHRQMHAHFKHAYTHIHNTRHTLGSLAIGSVFLYSISVACCTGTTHTKAAIAYQGAIRHFTRIIIYLTDELNEELVFTALPTWIRYSWSLRNYCSLAPTETEIKRTGAYSSGLSQIPQHIVEITRYTWKATEVARWC